MDDLSIVRASLQAREISDSASWIIVFSSSFEYLENVDCFMALFVFDEAKVNTFSIPTTSDTLKY